MLVQFRNVEAHSIGINNLFAFRRLCMVPLNPMTSLSSSVSNWLLHLRGVGRWLYWLVLQEEINSLMHRRRMIFVLRGAVNSPKVLSKIIRSCCHQAKFIQFHLCCLCFATLGVWRLYCLKVANRVRIILSRVKLIFVLLCTFRNNRTHVYGLIQMWRFLCFRCSFLWMSPASNRRLLIDWLVR